MRLEVQDGLLDAPEGFLGLTGEEPLVELHQADPAGFLGIHGRDAQALPQDLVGDAVDLGDGGDGHPAADQLDVGLLGWAEGAVVAQHAERAHRPHAEGDRDQQADDDQQDDQGFLPEGTGRGGGGHRGIICRI